MDTNRFAVYYQKEFKASRKTPTTWREEDYVFMGNITAESLDQLFAILNDGTDTPNPLGSVERQAFIRHMGLHTSMSVNDIAVDRNDNTSYICAPFCWEPIQKVTANPAV